MRKSFNLPAIVAGVVASVGAVGSALADPPAIPDASTVLDGVATSVGGYSTVMFAIAIASVGVLIGVKWIKRARGAA